MPIGDHQFNPYPDVELDVFVGDGLHVESYGGDCVDGLAQLEFVEDGGLAGRVQTQHEDAHLLVAKHLGQDLAHLDTDDGPVSRVSTDGTDLGRAQKVHTPSRACSNCHLLCDSEGVSAHSHTLLALSLSRFWTRVQREAPKDGGQGDALGEIEVSTTLRRTPFVFFALVEEARGGAAQNRDENFSTAPVTSRIAPEKARTKKKRFNLVKHKYLIKL